ncbi:MAG: hypothetical protein KJP03_09005, partial [Gammaproteobacteria bacterium]|nr:hypothetical protein [Gammaproteobacteria bacterium]
AQAAIATCEDEVLHYWGWNRTFIRHAIDTFWQRHENSTFDEMCADFDPTALARLPGIHPVDKLGARFDAWRWQLNGDGRFACIALRSALRQCKVDPVIANQWLAVHKDFVDRQANADAVAAARLRAGISPRLSAASAQLQPADDNLPD